MDKNYNVDDILSEIKNRKSREKGASQPTAPETRAPSVPEFRFGSEPEPAIPTHPELPESDGPGMAQFDFRPEEEPPNRANPMDFTGYVRPLTDRAKMRGNRIGQPSHLVPPREQPGSGFGFDPGAAEANPGDYISSMPDFPSTSGVYSAPPNGYATPNDYAMPETGYPPLPEEEPEPVMTRVSHVDFGAFRTAEAETRVLPEFQDPEEVAFEEEVKPKRLGVVSREEFETVFDEDEDDGIPEHSKIDFSEYNSQKDRRDVATDIARVKLWLFVRVGLTFLLAAALVYLAMSGKYEMPLPAFAVPVGETMRGYLISCTALTALVALINSSAVGGGVISLFRGRANSDTLAAFAILAALGQSAVSVANVDTADPFQLNTYFSVAALAMFFNAVGKMSMINRIQTNFRVIASDRKKRALLTVDNDGFCRAFVPDATRRPTIAYGVSAGFFTDFLGLSYSDKYDVGVNRAVAPVCLIASIVVGMASYVLGGELDASVSALTAVLCVAATLSATFTENIPLGKLAKKLHPMGGMVSGNKAVEDFCDTEAVILTETDLFPEGNVQLRGIKSFSQGRIDEAILDAASVMCSLEGALSPVFLQMIGGNRKLLKKVDNIVYENGMGVSAWVASRRVLIGNRQLMQNHGIAIPPRSAKAGAATSPSEGEMLYLSNSGEVSAQFAVSYKIDEELALQLDQLAAREKDLIIYTSDANITPHRIWELYGYPEEFIQVLPAERHAQFRAMAKPRERAIAEIVCYESAPAMVASILACMNARSSILIATILQLVQIVLGYGLVTFMAFMGSIGSLTILQLYIYQAFWFLAIFIVQKAKAS